MPRKHGSFGGPQNPIPPRLLHVALAAVLGACLAGCGSTRRSPGAEPSSGGSGSQPNETPPAVAGSGGTAAIPGEGAIDLDGAPEYFRVLRLTNSQWAASVREVLKLPDVSSFEAALPSPVLGVSDFSNNERSLDIDARYWADYQAASEALAAEVTASEATLDAVYPGRDASGFIEAVGRRAYRRPLTTEEVQVLQGVFDAGKATSGSNGEFAKGAALVLRTLLQSPYFLYRTELGEAGQPLSGYEAAAKLSLWLRGATPNDALLDIADTLTSAEAMGATAQRMLDDAAAS
jgi:hypothetical protein